MRRSLTLVAVLSLVLALMSPSALGQERSDREITEAAGSVELVSRFEAPTTAKSKQGLVPIIVKLDEQPVASYEGGIEGFAATSPTVLGTGKIEAESEAVVAYRDYLAARHTLFEATVQRIDARAEMTYSYDVTFGGVALLVQATSIASIAKLPGVEQVYLDRLEQLDTDTSPGFLRAGRVWNSLGGQSSAGEGVIVGVIDSGIWPEHPSFSDPDPAGNPFPAPVWAGTGTGDGCDFGNTAYNPEDAPFTCNNKLIGAYDFTDTYKAVVGLLPTEFDSARDSNGHGTHTISTAAGNGEVAATLLGVSRGMVSGISPRSHVAMYKGCGADGCFGSDTLASIQQATLDGVDVVNYSISGGGSPYSDAVSLGFLDAYNGGVLVTPSAGNSGPGADTVGHREPWTLTVGASTTDRSFVGMLMLKADNGDTLDVEGVTVTGGIDTWTPVVLSADALCTDAMAPGTFTGEIVLCDRGGFARVSKSYNVMVAGGAGMVLMNPVFQGLSTDNHFIPSLHVEDSETTLIKAFMAGHTGVEGMLVGGAPTASQGDVVAGFSSRGGPAQTLGISKPDIVAPGVQILAGNTPLPETPEGGQPGELFQAIQGTSMAAPHAAGVAALLKAAHPDWTPGEIKSAIMMSALDLDVFKEDGTTPADPYDMGTGRLRPVPASMAALTISDTGAAFVAHADDLWNSNYPSLYVPNLPGAITVERTVFNQTDADLDVFTTRNSPSDVKLRVKNDVFTLGPNGTPSASHTVQITVDARAVPVGETRHAMVVFHADGQRFRFPITIVRGESGITLDKTCAPATVAYGDLSTCTITAENTTLDDAEVTITDKLPGGMRVKNNTVVTGGIKVTPKKVTTTAFLEGAVPPPVSVAVDNFASPAGYLDLTLFTPTDVGATDESIANFTVPTFEYAGVSYDTIGVVSNGYIVVGGGTGADVDFINSNLPDGALPNNVLAPFWTDLNPSAGGTVYIELLTDGFDSWIVVEWQAVQNFGDGEPNTAQVWIGYDTDFDPSQDISFTYGSVSDGDGGFLTVGAEDVTGTTGGTTYFDGAGTPPAPSFGGGSEACDTAWPAAPCYEVDVASAPGAPGGSAVLSFTARGTKTGTWTNWAKMIIDGGPFMVIEGFDFTVGAP